MTCEMDMSGKCKLKETSDTDFAFIKRRSKESEPFRNDYTHIEICSVEKSIFLDRLMIPLMKYLAELQKG